MLNRVIYLTASSKYPERYNHSELTPELLENADELIEAVNSFLLEIGVDDLSVSSGFRPKAVNAATKGASTTSQHMICRAVDLVDKDGSLSKKCAAHPDLLRKYGLFLENPVQTKGWCHLDKSRTRADRPSRVFSAK